MRKRTQSERVNRNVTAYKGTFSTDFGKIVLKDLLKTCSMMSTSYNGNVNDTFYNEGRRSVVLQILQKLAITEDQLREIIQSTDED